MYPKTYAKQTSTQKKLLGAVWPSLLFKYTYLAQLKILLEYICYGHLKLFEVIISVSVDSFVCQADDVDMGEYYSPLLSVDSEGEALSVKGARFTWGVGKYSLHDINFLALKVLYFIV